MHRETIIIICGSIFNYICKIDAYSVAHVCLERILSYFLLALTCPLHVWTSWKCTGFCKLAPSNYTKAQQTVAARLICAAQNMLELSHTSLETTSNPWTPRMEHLPLKAHDCIHFWLSVDWWGWGSESVHVRSVRARRA